MAVITVGVAPGAFGSDYAPPITLIQASSAANDSGIITSISFFVRVIGTFDFALFYLSGAGAYTTRSYIEGQVYGTTGLKTISGLSLAVATGDFIGYASVDGRIHATAAAGQTVLRRAADNIPCVGQGSWTTTANTKVAVQGTGTTVPSIASLTQNHGRPGDSMVIAGSYFDAAQGAGGVTVNGIAATVTSWAAASITVDIPVGATTGPVIVTNNTGGVSAGVTWSLDPEISTLTPDTGPVGQAVVIDGDAFGAAQGAGGVTVNGVAATVTAWADAQITIVVPVGATTGNVIVTTNGGLVSNGALFTVTIPAAAAGSGPSVGSGPIRIGAAVCAPPIVG